MVKSWVENEENIATIKRNVKFLCTDIMRFFLYSSFFV